MTSLPAPKDVQQELPLSPKALALSQAAREAVIDVLAGRDRRLIILAGPCSIHSEEGALEYADYLAGEAERYKDKLLVLMRCYVEKSRTGLGWKGLARDPRLDGSAGTAEGVRLARRIMLGILDRGVALGTELASPYLWPFWIDALSWASVGARGVESIALRECAQSLPCACGFKNGRDGSLDTAAHAIATAYATGLALSMGGDGRIHEFEAGGNPLPHLILRGSDSGPNWRAAPEAERLLAERGLPTAMLVDASHGNSRRTPRSQREAALGALQLRAEGVAIRGIMIESYLEDGVQELVPGCIPHPGQSITDPCLGKTATAALLAEIADRA